MKLWKREPVVVLAVVLFVLQVAAEVALDVADAADASGGRITVAGVLAAVFAALQRREVTPTSAPTPAPEEEQ